jgi:hypothetical protein
MQTNADLRDQALRCQVAGKQPKWHIPIGILGFFFISSRSPIGWLPWVFAVGVLLHAEKQNRKNGKAIKDSYGTTTLPDGTVVSNAHVLEKRLNKGEKEIARQVAQVYPPHLPFGQKKPQPLPQPKQQLPREGAATAKQGEKSQPVAQTANPTPTSGQNGSTPKQDSGSTVSNPPLQWRDGEHFVMIGLSGSSKTTTLLNCVPNNSLVVYVTLKSEDMAPKEWKAYRLRKFPDLSFLVQLENLCAMIRGLVSAKVNHRFIIDESLTILNQAKAALKTVVDKEDKAQYGAVIAEFEGLLKMYIWTGRSDGHWLGMVTQSPNGTDLFDSAKTMQGLKTVLCAGEASSNGFDFLPDWAKQKFGQFVTAEDDKFFRSLRTGYWHFWVEGGKVQRRKTPRNTRQLYPIPMLSKFESLVPIGHLHGEDLQWSQCELGKEPVIQQILSILSGGPKPVSYFTQGQVYQQLRQLETEIETLDFDGPIKHWIEPMLGFRMVRIDGAVLSAASTLSIVAAS